MKKASACLLYFFSSIINAAANFDISPTPGTTLPTTVPIDTVVSASYTITNRTQSTLSGYHITGLPKTVTQNTDTGNCPKRINLGAGESCILILDIKGEAISNFAICKGSTCTSASVPLHVVATDEIPIPLKINVGVYSSSTGIRPLLALNTGGGDTWTYPSEPTFPDTTPAFVSGQYSSTSCYNNLCIITGFYSDGSIRRPLLGLSTDRGDTWTYPEDITMPSITPAYADSGHLWATDCNARLCVAGGHYRDDTNNQYPLLARSSDGGGSWTFPEGIIEPNTTPEFQGNASIRGTGCYGIRCLAAGHYFDISNAQRPMVGLSTDAGQTWTYPITMTNPDTQPTFGTNGRVYSLAKCATDTFITTGFYVDGDGGIHRPLLGLSIDGGNTWTFPTSITQPETTPAFVDIGILIVNGCSDNICIASGRYNDGTTTRPLLAMSTDACQTWTYPTSITEANLPVFQSGTLTGGASCSGNLCIAVGSYVDDEDPRVRHPLLALSKDAGKTWTYPEAVINPDTTPKFQNTGQLFGASCSGRRCIATGRYQAVDGLIHPLMAVTTDYGATWTFPETITDTSTIPDYVNNGRLGSGGIEE